MFIIRLNIMFLITRVSKYVSGAPGVDRTVEFSNHPYRKTPPDRQASLRDSPAQASIGLSLHTSMTNVTCTALRSALSLMIESLSISRFCDHSQINMPSFLRKVHLEECQNPRVIYIRHPLKVAPHTAHASHSMQLNWHQSVP